MKISRITVEFVEVISYWTFLKLLCHGTYT